MSYRRLTTAIAALFLATPFLATLCAQDIAPRDSLLVARPEPRIAPPATATPPAPIVAAGVTAPRRTSASRTSANAVVSQESSESSHGKALMIFGGAAIVVGAVVGGKVGGLTLLGGAIIGLYGLWRYVQ